MLVELSIASQQLVEWLDLKYRATKGSNNGGIGYDK